MESIKALLVDDEQMALMSLKGLIQENFPEVTIVGECQNLPEALRLIRKTSPEVVFLDIEMPEYSGFDLFEFLSPDQIDFHIVFVTAYSDYSLQAFEYSATDYLLKPVKTKNLERALQKVKNSQVKPLGYQTLLDNLKEGIPSAQKLILQTANEIYVIKLLDIVYLEAQGSYTKFVTDQHGELLISQKIANFDFLEKSPLFFRCHRSYVVNLQRVSRIDKRSNQLALDNGQSVHIAQERRKDLLEKISRA